MTLPTPTPTPPPPGWHIRSGRKAKTFLKRLVFYGAITTIAGAGLYDGFILKNGDLETPRLASNWFSSQKPEKTMELNGSESFDTEIYPAEATLNSTTGQPKKVKRTVRADYNYRQMELPKGVACAFGIFDRIYPLGAGDTVYSLEGTFSVKQPDGSFKEEPGKYRVLARRSGGFGHASQIFVLPNTEQPNQSIYHNETKSRGSTTLEEAIGAKLNDQFMELTDKLNKMDEKERKAFLESEIENIFKATYNTRSGKLPHNVGSDDGMSLQRMLRNYSRR